MTWTKVLMSTNGLRSTFIILAVAGILTVYELGTFYMVIVPTIKNKIKNALEKIGNTINQLIIDKQITLPRTKINDVLEIFDSREQLLLEKINTYTKYTGGVILVVITIALLVIRQMLATKGFNIALGTYMNILVTITLIGIFQYSFFNYGQKYKYIGAYGEEELVGYLLENLELDQKLPVTS